MIELAGRRIGEALNRIRARGLPLGQVGELTELSVAQAKRLGAAATGQTGRHRRPGRAALDRGGGGREPVRWSPPLGEGRPRAASRGGWNCRRWAACSPATVVCRPRGRRTAMRLVMDRGRQGCCGGPGRRPVARRPCAATVPRWSARGGGSVTGWCHLGHSARPPPRHVVLVALTGATRPLIPVPFVALLRVISSDSERTGRERARMGALRTRVDIGPGGAAAMPRPGQDVAAEMSRRGVSR